MQTVSIIVPAFNEEKYIGACLSSILQSRIPEVQEIIVVDNASTDGTATVARTFPGITVVREETKGTSAARHCGFTHAKGDLLIFIDADSIMTKKWLQSVLHIFARSPRVVCISGPYFFYDAPRILLIPKLLYWWLLAWPISLFTPVAVGGGMGIRRSALQSIGGFDASITFYGDDTNIAMRLSKEGRILFHPLLILTSSARRMKKEGFVRTVLTYVFNFFTQVFFKKSWTREHRDIR